jgi:tetratricopeptide (TPR) repeat protein
MTLRPAIGAMLVWGCALGVPASVAVAPTAPEASAAAASGDLAAAIKLFESGPRVAKPAFEAVLRRDPRSLEAAFYLGRIAYAAEETEGAIARFAEAVAGAPGSSLYHMWLGRAYAQKAIKANNFQRPFIAPTVHKEMEKAVALDSENIDARFDLARFFILAPGIMGGSTEKAKEQAAEIKKRNPLQGHQCYAMIYEELDKPELAGKEYLDAVREYPADRKARLWLGIWYQDRGKYDEAFAAFEALAKLDPPERAALYQIGKTGVLSGKNLDRAEECFLDYLKSEPKEGEPGLAWTHYRLGMLYEKKGDKPLARREYTETLRLAPDHQDAKKALAKLGPQ